MCYTWLQGDKSEEAATTRVLLVKQAQQSFVFTEVPEQPVPSLLRNFSAPVKLQVERSLCTCQPGVEHCDMMCASCYGSAGYRPVPACT